MDNPGPNVIPLEDHGHKTDHHIDIQVPPHVDSPKTVRKSLTKFLKKHYRTKSTATKQKQIVKPTSEHASLVDLHNAESAEKQDAYKKDFLIRLAKSLHIYGSPVYRTEYNLTYASAAMGIEGMYCVFPTLLIASFGDIDSRNPAKAETHILRVDQGLNCEKLHCVDELADNVIKHLVDVHEAQEQLSKIISSPARYNSIIKLFCLIFSAGCIAPLFFNGGLIEFGFSLLSGLIVGLTSMLVEKFPVWARLCDPVSATLVSFVAKAAATTFTDLCFYTTVLSGIIWLLPGLTLTISVMELSTKNMVSGSSRIFYAFLLLLQLGFGIALGNSLVVWNTTVSPEACGKTPIDPWWFIPLFLGVAIPFNVLLDAHPRQWPSMTVSSAIGVFLPFGLSYVIKDANLISFAGSFAIGIYGTIYSRYTKHPAIVPILSGIIMLVPGSVGVRGVSTMLISNDIVSGLNFTFQMMFIALSITGGLLFAHVLVFPKKVLAPILL